MKTINDMRDLAREIEVKRKLNEKAKEEQKQRENKSLYSAAEDKRRRILQDIHSSRRVKVENFFSVIRYDFAIVFICVSAMIASIWMCRDLIPGSGSFFNQPRTKILQAESQDSTEVNEQLHRLLAGNSISTLVDSGKLALGNVSGRRKDEIYWNLSLLSGKEFEVNTIIARSNPEGYSAFCSFDKAGGYIIELARSGNGFSITKIDSDN
ncbi:MAG TPA: hypothetical protein DET40_24730 [Lentisphaeria bacterium]|nr:MAG: hypothetical protein A2X45_01275 [Lentisphaerae bacterium GWF2_50_93]HCE46766.1 hypothetical protein [Lentisphaeria bacterium]